MGEFGLEHFPTPKKGRQSEAILKKPTTSTEQQEQPENCHYSLN